MVASATTLDAADRLKGIFRAADKENAGTIRTTQLKALLAQICPSLPFVQVEKLCVACHRNGKDCDAQNGTVGEGFVDYSKFVDYLCAAAALPKDESPTNGHDVHVENQKLLAEKDCLQLELDAAKKEASTMRSMLKRQSPEFTVGQYNILAGYLGNNTEPWFLYGVDMPDDRRAQIVKLHQTRLPDGKPANPGWPNYVRGVLSDEEQKVVELYNDDVFAWEKRKDKLVDVIRQIDTDVLCLVECDHYDDHFRPALESMGYASIWKKRPRPSSLDGCCVAWKVSMFELVGYTHVEYVDKYCPATKRTFKDRIALIVHLRMNLTGESIVLVSTHLQRNPEDPTQDMLRARQVGQVLRELALFAREHEAEDSPVILTGDLNCTSFGRLRGIANALSLMSRDTFLHPFTFDCSDVPTGVTSVTTARCMRIDAIMYQSQRLELTDVLDMPELAVDNPIPSVEHPSDHVPMSAKFKMRNKLHTTRQNAKDWFLCVSGEVAAHPLTMKQLRAAWRLYEHDGSGLTTPVEMRQALISLFGSVPDGAAAVLAKIPPDGLEFETFVSMYLESIRSGGLPGLADIHDAFRAFDTNGDGTLELTEFLEAFRMCAPAAVPEEELTALFNAIDTSGDGLIEDAEFVQHLANVWIESFDLRS
eukprot:TRINITY_DN14227_c0_g1_i1.p1 TRINITY_DN14227_c0_g1~~TRINITY_DN14227_c0_g1_i1.p1  ORF type:complete len:670 (-),score=113.93 TRINITY_DN14227_c0_g1_i1:205-2148(-)